MLDSNQNKHKNYNTSNVSLEGTQKSPFLTNEQILFSKMAKVQILRNPISRQKILINDLQNILKLSNLMHKEDYKLYQIAMKTYPGYIQTYQSLEKLTQNPKPNILLVHGYCFSIADWHKTLPYLQNHYNVYAID